MSASILQNRFIYVFGGMGIDTIEEYDITQRQTWIVLDIKLPKELSRIGCISISPTEILLFGGISAGLQQQSYIFNQDSMTI